VAIEERSDKEELEKAKNKLFLVAAAGTLQTSQKPLLELARRRLLQSLESESPLSRNDSTGGLSDKGREQAKRLFEAHGSTTGLGSIQLLVRPQHRGASYRRVYAGKDLIAEQVISNPDYLYPAVLAHELGHREVAHTPGLKSTVDKMTRVTNKLYRNNPAASVAPLVLASALSEGPKALAGTVGLSYLMRAPSIINEALATTKGINYMKTAGFPVPKNLTVTQLGSYAVKPLTTALGAYAAGQAVRIAGQKIKEVLNNRKNQKPEQKQEQY